MRIETLPGGARKFHLEVRLGRAAPCGDRAAGGAGAEVVLDAAGVSRHDATRALSCVDPVRPSTFCATPTCAPLTV
jgi:hypothetical protein